MPKHIELTVLTLSTATVFQSQGKAFNKEKALLNAQYNLQLQSKDSEISNLHLINQKYYREERDKLLSSQQSELKSIKDNYEVKLKEQKASLEQQISVLQSQLQEQKELHDIIT